MTKERLSATFWSLAGDRGRHLVSAEPADVVRVLLTALDGLEGRTASSRVAADALSFLMRLEHDPHYASPEQCRGGEKDSRALVYSLGVLLFEKLTGHHPFVESLSPVAAAVVRDRCRPRGGANNLCSLPGDLRALLARAMSPFPEDRHAHISELRDDLERFAARHPAAEPEPEALHAMPRAPRHRTIPPPPPGSEERARFERRRESAMRLIVDPLPPAPAPIDPDEWPQLPPAPSLRPLSIRRPRVRLAGAAVAGFAAVALAGLVAARTIGGDRDAQAAEATAATVPPRVPAAISPEAAATHAHTIPAFTVRAATPAEDTATPARDERTGETSAPREERAPFDVADGAAATLAATRTCLSDGRLRAGVQIGVSLRYSATTGESVRVYLANNPISGAETRCLAQRLLGLRAGGVPRRATTVTYNLWITATTGRHRARVAR